MNPFIYFRLCLIIILLIAVTFSTAEAGNTGKIAGKVIDAKTKEPLVGANVLVVGTSLGAATDFDGAFAILNVPPGIYSLRASLLGYGTVLQSNLKVSIDLTTQANFELLETTVDVQEVLVVAERPIVQKDLTAKTAVVGGDQISALPVTEVNQVLQLQAGVVAGSVRGGRSGEVAYWIDGVPVTDAFNGSQVVEVNKSLVQELQLISGAFNAEYGQAMSGIVNIATKEGGARFKGGLGTYAGGYVVGNDGIYTGLSSVKPTSIRNFEGNASGPIIGDKLTFFANGRYIYFDGHLKGYRRFNPSNYSYTDATTGEFRYFRDTATGMGDGALVSMNPSERWYGQGKFTWHATSMLKLNANFIYDYNKSKAYNRSFFYNPDGIGNNYSTSNTLLLQLTHTLSSSTFYTLGGSYFDKRVEYYLYDLDYAPATDGSGDLWEVVNPSGPRYVHPELFLTEPYSFFTGGTDLGMYDRSTKTGLVKFDISSQLDKANLVKVGAEFRKHGITLENILLQPIEEQSDIEPSTADPYIRTRIRPDTTDFHDFYKHSPAEFSAYIQDKLELENFILNIGVRFDYFEPDGVVLADESDPDIRTPIRPENQARTLEERKSYWYKKVSPKAQWSPRVGASFPITASGVVHFSYGHFFQIPRFERLYENSGFKIGKGTGNQGLIGNADLEPEQTVNAEIGIQQQITDDISVDLTAYLRDIRGLTGSRGADIQIFGESASYTKYINSDFGTVKGIVVTLTKRFAEGLSSTVDYTYQVAQGSASDPQQARNAVIGGSLPEVQLTPLGWDQRHTLNMTAAYDQRSWGVSFIGQYGSGTPFTPRTTKDITSLLTNSQTKPAFFNLDARAFYEIPFNPLKLVLFARVFNLLDTRNEVNVFDDTGRAGFTTDEDRARATNPHERINTLDQWFLVPTNFSEPRRIEFGMNLEF